MSETVAAPAGLRARLRRTVRRLLAEHASPSGLGLAVGIGALIACTPFYGLQTLMALAVAWLLRVNRPAILIASNVSFPPLTPVIVFADLQVGALLLRGRFLSLSLTELRGGGALELGSSLFGAWLLGGLVVGAALGAVLGLATFAVARARQRRPAREARAALGRAARRYGAAPPRERYYARIKYRWDPVYLLAAEELLPLAREGRELCDLGCGVGMLGLLLAEAESRASILGLDWDEAKLQLAAAAADGLEGVRFRRCNLLLEAPPPCAGAALIDVLHYHPPAAQQALLARVAGALTAGGRLLVRETDAAGGSRLGRLLEGLGVRLGWHRTAGAFHYRSAAALREMLEGLGLAVRIRPAGGLFHGANVLLCADKPPEQEQTAGQ